MASTDRVAHRGQRASADNNGSALASFSALDADVDMSHGNGVTTDSAGLSSFCAFLDDDDCMGIDDDDTTAYALLETCVSLDVDTGYGDTMLSTGLFLFDSSV
ncbi:hypothetical protein SPRG_13904 [Saprolegnia parasitica CBS 223.65]|uniref:Uncharacterized protein n=1 Tax=Saprolegnia parasitica (strain CBS 223.65) TaxID=695850 RepID=A0A067C1P6_SAPPC|nr:hypothetical protein SPRG_13904 [Saprolegnia parasitica CBS 223.65]KDO20692.1 hypothetical protein SPRG_13904 [Saprolegnia parasitica CBS 223.65]|eukprot:XP_012208576.1 hypothetical protein SPRG_13904 [Saprolegnia parasitica CBS 223.65]